MAFEPATVDFIVERFHQFVCDIYQDIVATPQQKKLVGQGDVKTKLVRDMVEKTSGDLWSMPGVFVDDFKPARRAFLEVLPETVSKDIAHTLKPVLLEDAARLGLHTNPLAWRVNETQRQIFVSCLENSFDVEAKARILINEYGREELSADLDTYKQPAADTAVKARPVTAAALKA